MRYLIIILLLSSCYNARKAGQQATKAMETYPAQTASLFRGKWPCIDGEVKPGDSTLIKQFQEDLKTLQDFYNSQEPQVIHDTLIESWADTSKIDFLKKQNKALQTTIASRDKQIAELFKRCNDVPVIRDTLPVRDSSEAVTLKGEILHRDKIIVDKDKTISEQKDKLQKRGRWNLIWFIAFLLSLLVNVIQFKTKR